MTHNTATTAQQSCQPWCTDHANGSPANAWPLAEDQICRTTITNPAFGGIDLGHNIADGNVVSLYNARLELTVAEARQFAFAILAATEQLGRADR